MLSSYYNLIFNSDWITYYISVLFYFIGKKLTMSLSLIRKKIEEIDENIITLIAQRFRFLPEIIEEKKKHGLRAFQPEREQQLQMMYHNLAMKLNLDPNLIQTIMAIIVKEMRQVQENSLS